MSYLKPFKPREKIQKPTTNNWLIDELVKRLKGNMNFIGSVLGQTGYGKSYTAIRICELLSKRLNVPFTVDNIYYSISPLIRAIMNDAPKYSCFIIDEAGVSLDSHKWYTDISENMKYIAETFRYKRYVVLIVAPNIDQINKNLRKLSHAYFACLQKNGKEIRVYSPGGHPLFPTGHYRGQGRLVNIKPPSYEDCKEKSFCTECVKYSSNGPDRCELLRANYERKKDEASKLMLMWIMKKQEKALEDDPYNPYEIPIKQHGGTIKAKAREDEAMNKLIDAVKTKRIRRIFESSPGEPKFDTSDIRNYLDTSYNFANKYRKLLDRYFDGGVQKRIVKDVMESEKES